MGSLGPCQQAQPPPRKRARREQLSATHHGADPYRLSVKHLLEDQPVRWEIDCRLLVADKKALLVTEANRPDIKALGQSILLSKARSFLPSLRLANEQLKVAVAEDQAGNPDIETLSSETGPHIELDLACGVLDLQNEAAEAAAHRVATSPVEPMKQSACKIDSNQHISSSHSTSKVISHTAELSSSHEDEQSTCTFVSAASLPFPTDTGGLHRKSKIQML